MNKIIATVILVSLLWGCKVPETVQKTENKSVPVDYGNPTDSANIARQNWKAYFNDPYLADLVDTALANNRELNIVLQEIEISKNEIQVRKGEYLPFAGIQAGAGYTQDGKYTWKEGVNQNLDVHTNSKTIESNSELGLGLFASWEIDVWKKLHNAKKSAVTRYLAGMEGKNFMVTNLVAEIANSYYELMALDNMLQIVKMNMDIQGDALKVVKLQKESARVTQLAVNRFEAQLLNTNNLQYALQQKIVETENRINFLTGRFPKPIMRNSEAFAGLTTEAMQVGIPTNLLENRPDIRQAELELEATKLDVKVARANFYPSLRIQAGVGFQAINPAFLFNPQSLVYNLAGDLMAPLINRNAIKAAYLTANARQLQAVYNYEQTILSAYLEVMNQLSKTNNFASSYNTKQKEVDILNQSVNISNNLFRSARADYMEVLLTQREALESKMQLMEIKIRQINARVDIYRALGGGWN